MCEFAPGKDLIPSHTLPRFLLPYPGFVVGALVTTPLLTLGADVES